MSTNNSVPEQSPLTRDDVRAIVSEEIGKLGGLLLKPVLNSNEAPLKFEDRVHGEGSDGALDDLIWSPVVDNLEESIAEFVRDRQLGRDDLVSQPVGGTHNSSPSVDDAGAHSVGDGPGAGDASATPATEVTDKRLTSDPSKPYIHFSRGGFPATEGSLSKRLHDSAVRKSEALGRVEKAERKLCNAREDLAYAENEQREASAAYDAFIFGGSK